MEIIIREDAHDASVYTADLIAQQVRRKADSVLGLATGSTPEMVYKELVRIHQEKSLSFKDIVTFNLDEYVGLVTDHEQSYHYYMAKNLFEHIDVDAARTNFPNTLADDIPAACRAYEEKIVKAGGIDLQLLGIGSDGHIGFNEPTSSLASRTRIKTLTDRTIEDNARFFGSREKVPFHVVTMGIGTIREARSIVLMALGDSKADAVADMVEGPVTAMVPASILQMHPSIMVVLDPPAASKLKRAGYYKWVFDHKPDWQSMVPPGQ